jgi:hypothetical protein
MDFVDEYSYHLTKEYAMECLAKAREKGWTKELDPETWGKSYGVPNIGGVVDETPRETKWDLPGGRDCKLPEELEKFIRYPAP